MPPPDLNSYLRFDAQGLTGSLTSATLRVYANSGLSTGYEVFSVSDNTWTETGITLRQAQAITYSNAPAMGASLGSSGTFSANSWTTVDGAGSIV